MSFLQKTGEFQGPESAVCQAHIAQHHELSQGIVMTAPTASILKLFNNIFCTCEQLIH